MATKNIYVSDNDLSLFDQATTFAGSASAAVIAGLRLYVAEQEKAKEMATMHSIKVEVQHGAIVTTQRFRGRRLRYEIRDGLRVTTYHIYLTAHNQIAV
ncbi:MAG: hypothetical protein QM589_12890 [Thermomicrobiales bacterium]